MPLQPHMLETSFFLPFVTLPYLPWLTLVPLFRALATAELTESFAQCLYRLSSLSICIISQWSGLHGCLLRGKLPYPYALHSVSSNMFFCFSKPLTSSHSGCWFSWAKQSQNRYKSSSISLCDDILIIHLHTTKDLAIARVSTWTVLKPFSHTLVPVHTSQNCLEK